FAEKFKEAVKDYFAKFWDPAAEKLKEAVKDYFAKLWD
nr:Chain C, NSPr peptide [synthetic construct]8T56_D Chain D, NSPr peptide [synthetic construct]8T56_E Chain E, NSPr peptide [synthetic construct]8T56_F Chain F, NSPr peptide [synthetic construct]8T56_G Chain G, NSPr peptide [synthetic construct]8T56_H Chain H, NSPr peptide [synthetic construct]8T56_I Chain I, NSPr peptide [synthetic construct]8T56_J Chain J, NSPr peptide [synthetic construct]